MPENLFTMDILHGKIMPILAFLFVAWGIILTDIAKVHLSVLFLNGNKAMTVLLGGMPIAIMYVATGSDWESVFVTYTVANTFYTILVKPLKNFIR